MNIPVQCYARRHLASFTLVEMLVVLAIMIILASLSLTAFRSLTLSSALTNSSYLVNSVFADARQDAISKNTLTSVVIMTQAGTPNAYATLSVWEYTNSETASSGGAWEQATPWKTLPPGIVFDNGTAANNPTLIFQGSTNLTPGSSYISTAQTATPYVGTNSAATATTALIPYLGSSLISGTAGSASSQGYACQTFLPSGRLYSSGTSPYTLLLDQGFYNNSGTITYTHLGTNNGPQDFALFFFNVSNGNTKIIRP